MFVGKRHSHPDHPLLALILVALIGCCSDGSTRRSVVPQGEPAESMEPAGTQGTAPDRPGIATAQPGDQDALPGSEGFEPSTQGTQYLPPAETGEQPVSIDIFSVMLGAGFILESDRDLADYLPVPPGATGQVGQFRRGQDSISIALVTYPAEIFANPHEGWIRERMALIPDSHERVLRLGATIIHIVAPTDDVADEIFQLFADLTASLQTSTPEVAP